MNNNFKIIIATSILTLAFLYGMALAKPASSESMKNEDTVRSVHEILEDAHRMNR